MAFCSSTARQSPSSQKEPIMRRYLNFLCGMVAITATAFVVPASLAADAKPVRIGIIGTGKIGGALATHWAKAGHELLISSRHPEELKELAKSLGPKVRVGTPQEAAAFGDVILLSVPYMATPQVGKDFAKELKGKVVIDTGNPYPQRDGAMAEDARTRGTGVTSAEFLPGVKLVRAFNAIAARNLAEKGDNKPERYAIPVAANDAGALEVAKRLVNEAGFEPVVVGDLSRAREFDFGTKPYVALVTAKELKKLFTPELP
jgi:predicted dinucleotide-binding enzyme